LGDSLPILSIFSKPQSISRASTSDGGSAQGAGARPGLNQSLPPNGTPQMLGVIGGQQMMTWGWVNTYRYIFSGMNIHLPAILGFTRYQGFDPSPTDDDLMLPEATKNDAGSGAQEAAAPTQAGSHP